MTGLLINAPIIPRYSRLSQVKAVVGYWSRLKRIAGVDQDGFPMFLIRKRSEF